MASETVDPTDWSHHPPSWAVPPELHLLHDVNAAYKSGDLLHQPGLERASTGMPDQHTTCAATQGMVYSMISPPVKKLAPLSTRSSSLMWVSAAEHHTAELYSKICRTEPRQHLPRSNLSWNTCQDFHEILSLWKAALGADSQHFLKSTYLFVYILTQVRWS